MELKLEGGESKKEKTGVILVVFYNYTEWFLKQEQQQ